ncbi:MAG: TlpA family protein disulfide reductase [Lachnospiraceae bacterium]|nr:TlpA family protein disulfide reductase [Lachnospiraceae bacterium]
MKRRLITLVLTGIILTGCAQNAESDIKNHTDSIASVETDSEEIAETEQEPYIVTFEGRTLEGEEFSSECFGESKLTMINVWATYCSPCLNEMPDLGEIASAYDKSEFQILGIVSDVMENGEDSQLEYAKELVTETKADYPHLVLNESLYTNLVGGIDSVPTTFFVNQEGEMLGYMVGAQSKDAWEELISELLADLP